MNSSLSLDKRLWFEYLAISLVVSVADRYDGSRSEQFERVQCIRFNSAHILIHTYTDCDTHQTHTYELAKETNGHSHTHSQCAVFHTR